MLRGEGGVFEEERDGSRPLKSSEDEKILLTPELYSRGAGKTKVRGKRLRAQQDPQGEGPDRFTPYGKFGFTLPADLQKVI